MAIQLNWFFDLSKEAAAPVAWDGNHDDTYDRNDIIAYNSETGQLYGLVFGQDPTGEAHRPFLDDGLVVFQVVSRNYTGLAIWHAGSPGVLPIITPTGSFYLHDFEGDWIALQLRHAGEDSGEYVWNIKTGEGYRYFEPSAEPEQRVGSVSLNRESVYWTFMERDNMESTEWKSHLFRMRLGSTEKEEIGLPAPKGGGVSAGNGFAVVTTNDGSDYDMFLLNLTTLAYSIAFEACTDWQGWFQHDDRWWGSCTIDGRDGKLLVNLASGEQTFHSFTRDEAEMWSLQFAWNGETMFLSGRASWEYYTPGIFSYVLQGAS